MLRKANIFKQDLYIVAEVANAAQGSVENYHRIIDEVSKTGADGIKFQFYKYDELATPYHRKYEIFRQELPRCPLYNGSEHR